MPCCIHLVNTGLKSTNESYPKCTRSKSDKGTAETGFFALGSNSLIDTFSKPNVRVDVPGIQKDFEIRRQLDFQYFDVGRTLPEGLARRSETGETKPSQDACTLYIRIS